ncbi:MAG TPA: outer membrane beta-barrel protein [Prolixibacteraceae bacterium]|nr:outer membrane beta-barrel protein [Prolixibacteraceae bacterium]
MKNRIFSILLILVLSSSFAMAQTTDRAKISFGILGGINFQNINGKAFNGDKLNNDMLMGFHGGVNVQIPVAPEFYFQPGVLFSIKGDKNKSDLSTSTTKLNYIEVPLNLVYKGALGNGFVMLGFGPYLAYGISGTVKTEGNSGSIEGDIKFKSTVESGDPLLVPYYKAFDAGANIFVGYEMASGMFLQLDTQFGMLNINPEYKEFPDSKTSEKNTGFGLSLGYRF